MEVAVPHAAHGVLVVAVEVDEGFEAVFLTGVKEPVDRPFLVGLAVVFEEIIEEILAKSVPSVTLQVICNETPNH